MQEFEKKEEEEGQEAKEASSNFLFCPRCSQFGNLEFSSTSPLYLTVPSSSVFVLLVPGFTVDTCGIYREFLLEGGRSKVDSQSA